MKKKALLNILILVSGSLFTFAFAPFNIYLLSLLAPAILLFVWLHSSPKQAFWRGLLFGLGWFAGGVSWVYISVHNYGFAPLPLALIITLGLIAALACFPAIHGYCLNRFFPTNNLTKIILVFPLTWVFMEWVRTWILTGFPWLLLGYTQIDMPLRNIAPILGVYGVSFFTAMTIGILVNLFFTKKPNKIFLLFSLVVTIWLGSWLLGKINWTHPTGAPIQVSLIQGNIPQEIKWQQNQTQNILRRYYQLTEQNWQSSIIIWSEGALPMFRSQAQPFINFLDQKAKQHNTTLIFGVAVDDQSNSKYYNAMQAVGKNHSLYFKRKLVPFGEYQPLASVTEFFMSMLQIPMSGFSPGSRNQPEFLADGIRIAPAICYETAYPQLQFHYLPAAQLLINITDDSWFGESVAAAQQLEMARMRSLEAGRYQLIGTNTGVTAIVKPNGEIQSQAPVFQEYVLSGKVYAMTGTTPWVRFGHYLGIMLSKIYRLSS
jgi:apolipoprotein N-acyltransferase